MDSLESVFDAIGRDATKKAQTDAKAAADMAISKALPVAARKMKMIFNKAIVDFYLSYTPIKYQRNMSMFDIFEVRTTNDSIIVNENEDAITPWHVGGSAANFDAAYKNGIHGRSYILSSPPEELYDNEASVYWEKEVSKMIERLFEIYWRKSN